MSDDIDRHTLAALALAAHVRNVALEEGLTIDSPPPAGLVEATTSNGVSGTNAPCSGLRWNGSRTSSCQNVSTSSSRT